MHTTVVLGVAMALATLDGLPGTVRCIFQPAEETMPGGATEVVASGVLDGATRAFALHCDPSVPGRERSACAPAPITAACDRIDVTLTGPGGHTARPQLTVDLVDALGRLITDLPGAALPAGRPPGRHVPGLGRGQRRASRPTRSRSAARSAAPSGCSTATPWKDAEDLMRSLVERVAATTGAEVDVDYVRGLPPVVNDPRAVALLRAAALETVGTDHVVLSPQSMGGEDFGWFADVMPIALARLGTHGGGPPLDLHRGHLRRRRAGDRGRRPAARAHRAARAGGRRGIPAGPTTRAHAPPGPWRHCSPTSRRREAGTRR